MMGPLEILLRAIDNALLVLVKNPARLDTIDAHLQKILSILSGKRVSFTLKGASMPTQTGTTFSIVDTAPTTGYSIMAQLLDVHGDPAEATKPQYGTLSDPQGVLTNFSSADQVTATFDIAGPGKLGSAQVPWSATNSAGEVVSGTAVISVISGTGVSVSFTLTTP